MNEFLRKFDTIRFVAPWSIFRNFLRIFHFFNLNLNFEFGPVQYQYKPNRFPPVWWTLHPRSPSQHWVAAIEPERVAVRTNHRTGHLPDGCSEPERACFQSLGLGLGTQLRAILQVRRRLFTFREKEYLSLTLKQTTADCYKVCGSSPRWTHRPCTLPCTNINFKPGFSSS